MNILDSKTLKGQARQILGETPCDIKKLTLIYCAVAAIFPILAEVLSALVLAVAPNTVGLSGLGKQSLYTTTASVLSLLPSLLLPFWGIGFLSICVGLVYRQSVTTRDLTAGFRRFWPFLRLFLLIGLIYVGIAFGASLLLTIFAEPLVAPLASLLNRVSLETGSVDIEYLLSQLPIGELVVALLPALLAVFALLLITILPMYYRLSMANYVLLESPELGAVAAISLSRRMTAGYCWKLFRLDLGFWWFYGLTVLASLLGLLPMIPAISQALPPLVSTILGAGLSYGAVFLVNTRYLPYISVTYAAAFKALQEDLVCEE